MEVKLSTSEALTFHAFKQNFNHFRVHCFALWVLTINLTMQNHCILAMSHIDIFMLQYTILISIFKYTRQTCNSSNE